MRRLIRNLQEQEQGYRGLLQNTLVSKLCKIWICICCLQYLIITDHIAGPLLNAVLIKTSKRLLMFVFLPVTLLLAPSCPKCLVSRDHLRAGWLIPSSLRNPALQHCSFQAPVMCNMAKVFPFLWLNSFCQSVFFSVQIL